MFWLWRADFGQKRELSIIKSLYPITRHKTLTFSDNWSKIYIFTLIWCSPGSDSCWFSLWSNTDLSSPDKHACLGVSTVEYVCFLLGERNDLKTYKLWMLTFNASKDHKLWWFSPKPIVVVVSCYDNNNCVNKSR